MSKIAMGPRPLIYPMPALLVGANVDGKPNFMTAAWGGIANSDPPMISVAIRHQRHTNKGIRQNMTFSVNIPSIDLVSETDYCGVESGARADKVKACNFKVFYGKLENAPLIEQCPVNLECKVKHILDLGTHTLFIGKIEETHVSEDCLTEGNPDVNKVKPFAYIMGPPHQYVTMGQKIAAAFGAGKDIKEK
jgi:flavin reductase (DIM6/NTAB) family NADH-FMN oxidoreductase RutF